jgi:HAMP domain-containing protein
MSLDIAGQPVKGEFLRIGTTVNTMVDQLSSFADEVTRVAREVGTEGELGGQAQVEGVSGTWRGLTESVNQLASTLTTQLRAMADVATAVTEGDLTRQIAVEAQGEVAELKDRVNQMIANLRDTTKQNAEQDWLKTNLARISGAMQGQRDLQAVSQLLMSEISPAVGAQHGAFFLAIHDEEAKPELRLVASYGRRRRRANADRFSFGEGLPGQAAVEMKSIIVTKAPAGYVRVSSGLGEAEPVNLMVLPILFEGQVLAGFAGSTHRRLRHGHEHEPDVDLIHRPHHQRSLVQAVVLTGVLPALSATLIVVAGTLITLRALPQIG